MVDPLAPDQLGPYRLAQRIAVGGMAEVFSAALPQGAGADRMVVVKRMLPRIATDPSARAMFGEEARLGRQIRHPNVVQVIDHGGSEQNPYIVLEFVQGVDLWRLMRFLTRTGRPLTVSEAVFIAREMLLGLHAVHEATDEEGRRLSVVHRDVSPSNVLLSVHGEVKLGDLGIARSRLREKFPDTSMHERAKGKLGYLAPEQVGGSGDADRRADVFSAGVVCAELLMGRPLFAGGSELAVLLAIRDSKVHPFIEFSRQLPPGLGEVVVDALAQKPTRRHGTAEIFADLLLPYLTEPVARVRANLARLVIEAQEAGPTNLPAQLTPTRTQTDPRGFFEGHDASFDAATPLFPESLLTPLGEPLESGTLKVGAVYRVDTTSHEQLGPWTFAEIVQAISTGRLNPLDHVSIDEGPPRVLCEIVELARHLPSSTATNDMETGRLRLSGELLPLDDGGIVIALGRAAVERSTALLLCELAGVRKEVYVKDGAPAFVTSNVAEELLGEYLVAHKIISRGELDMALAVMPRFEGRLGDTLSALGLVEPVMLFQHIAGQVRDKLIDLFLWTSGTCTHYHGVPPPPSGFPLNIDAWEVLDQGLKLRIERGLEETRMQRLRTKRLLPATGASLSAMRTALPQRMRRFLTELDRPRSMPDLIVRLSQEQEPDQIVRDAVLLLHLGALRLTD
ncbi:MAG: serine/threonine-protein kinase [Myxococcales bacterium]